MEELGKNKLFLNKQFKKTKNMGVGAIVIASAAVCAAFLILAEIRQRYL